MGHEWIPLRHAPDTSAPCAPDSDLGNTASTSSNVAHTNIGAVGVYQVLVLGKLLH